MAENSKIEWTDNTANFWWGCFKVSPGCKNCYADTLAKRYGKQIWGPASTSGREYKKAVWKNVLKWDKQAREANERRKLFVMSMGDFLEDHPQVIEWRNQAIDLLYSLTNTDVQLLTKRPENASKFLPESWFNGNWPAHIWMGTSVENQEQADKRIPELLKIPAAVRFLSMEPLLEKVSIEMIDGVFYDAGMPFPWQRLENPGIHWVIVGGESGHGKRPFNADWARRLQVECKRVGVPFFMKQIDKVQPVPDDLMIREMPKVLA